MRAGKKPTKAEFEEYKKAKRTEFEEWLARRNAERPSRFAKADLTALENNWKRSMKILSKRTWEEIDEHDEIDRVTMAPNFDERTFEEEHLGMGPLDDDDCYSPDGYYVYADRYDEAAKQRPPIRKKQPQAQTPAQPEPTPPEQRPAREPRETTACTA